MKSRLTLILLSFVMGVAVCLVALNVVDMMSGDPELSRMNACASNLRVLEAADATLRLSDDRQKGFSMTEAKLNELLSALKCLDGGKYSIRAMEAKCSVHGTAMDIARAIRKKREKTTSIP